VVEALDEWISSLATPEALAESQERGADDPDVPIRRRLNEIKIAPNAWSTPSSRAPIPKPFSLGFSNSDPSARASKTGLVTELTNTASPPAEVSDIIDRLGGLATVLQQAIPRKKRSCTGL
jgi:hypothetical protein